MTIQTNQVLLCDEQGQARVTLEDGEQVTLPAGGPYTVGTAENVLAGELWVLAGQSNMEGVGELKDAETPSPFVHSFQSREEWARAEEPLHWLGESPRLVHHKLWGREAVPDVPDLRDGTRLTGAGLGLTFAKERHARTGVPVGLIPSAHGGTSMAQWNPALKGEGGGSLYGATLARIEANGGKVSGILWYQGESDASYVDLPLYQDRMTALLKAFRDDLGQPQLPFYIVQIGRVISGPDLETIDGWNGIREAQRTWALAQPHVQMVTAVDLGLDDGIHIGTSDLKRLGRRLADAADGIPAPALRGAATHAKGQRVRVTFDQVRGGLRSAGRPEGFSLRHADGREWVGIYKTTLSGAAVTLCLTELLPPDVSLWYGWGVNPYCNVTDSQDGAVPAFGPVEISRSERTG